MGVYKADPRQMSHSNTMVYPPTSAQFLSKTGNKLICIIYNPFHFILHIIYFTLRRFKL